MKIDELKSAAKSYKSVYIYGFGVAGKWLCTILDNKVSGFIETDIKKSGEFFEGVQVYSYEDARGMVNEDSLVIISVIDIQDILDLVKNTSCGMSIALGLYLDEIEEHLDNDVGESTEFLEYSLNAVKKCHDGFFDKNILFLRSVDLVITEKCSLKCRDCSNLMQYYSRPIDIDQSSIMTSLNQLLNNVDYIYEIRLIGGEPFMNKEIYQILDYLYPITKIEKVVVYTNGMIPLKMEKYATLKNSKLVFSVTDYGTLGKNTKKFIEDLKKLDVTYRSHEPEYWTDSGKIHDFNRTEEGLKEIFTACCGKNLLTLSDDKLYRCPFAANADRLNAIPINENNFVKVSDSSDKIKAYTRDIEYLPACNFCNGRSFDSPKIVPAVQAAKPLEFFKHKND